MSATSLEQLHVESLLESSIASGAEDLSKQLSRPSSFFWTLITTLEVIADITTATVGILAAVVLYVSLGFSITSASSLPKVLGSAVFLSVCVVLMLQRDGGYAQAISLLRVKETERVMRATCIVALFALPLGFLARVHVPSGLLPIALLTVMTMLVIEKYLAHRVIRWLHGRGYGVTRVVIYGAGLTGRRVFSTLARSPKLGLNPVAFVDDAPALTGSKISAFGYNFARKFASVLSGPLTPDLLQKSHASHVIIAIPQLDHDVFVKTISDLLSAKVTVSFVPNHVLPFDTWVDYVEMDGLLLASFKKTSPSRFYEWIKRALDIAISIFLLAVLSPLMLGIAFLIRRNSKGPIFFTQERVGKDGHLFKMYKYRSMHACCPAYEFSPKESSDARITSIGRFLRKSSLDELPQLVNVLKGEMSLVGPRPEMPFIVNQYTPVHRQRLLIKPGLTGLWQLSADRQYLIHENIEYDLYYIRNRSTFMDLSILVHTVFFAMRGI